MKTPAPEPVLDAVIRFDNLPATGRDLHIAPDASQLLALRDVLKVSEVESFSADLTAKPLRGGIRVLGSLKARIVQPCVVTFEPVTQDIDEPVDRLFLQGAESPKGGAGAEVFVDLEDEDLPDHIEGPEVDLAPLLIEVLALAIDPYPRATGASVEKLGVKLDAEEPSPFAKLAALKTPRE